jgi:hypothetical protein
MRLKATIHAEFVVDLPDDDVEADDAWDSICDRVRSQLEAFPEVPEGSVRFPSAWTEDPPEEES